MQNKYCPEYQQKSQQIQSLYLSQNSNYQYKNYQSDETGDKARKQPCINKTKDQGPLQSNLYKVAQQRDINDDHRIREIIMFKVEWEFLNNHLQNELDKMKQEYQCSFQMSSDQNLRIDPILKFNGKQVILCGDLDNYKYDAQIVEIDECVTEPQFNYDVQINQYFCLKEPKLIKDGQSNIIQISTSLYGQATKAFEYFRSSITKILKIAHNEKYESLVIPIFGESQFFSFETACRGVLTSVIQQINQYLFTKNVIIFEQCPQKLQKILNTLLDLLHRQTLTKFQWQFYDNRWIDYDYQINQQIDQQYEQYQKDKSKNEIEFNFPYFGTNLHKIRKYKIKFSDKGVIQLNLETNTQRNVYFKYFVNYPILDKDKFELKLEKSLGQQKYQVIIDIKSSNKDQFNQIEKQIRDLLEKNQQKFNWKVKNFKDEDLIAIEKTIRKRSIQFEGQIKQGNELQIKCFNKKAKKLQDYLYDIEKQFIIFPQGWIPQQQNLMKVRLNNNDEDYKKVQKLFHQSYSNGRIFQINRIQNKILYENFINEKRKLIQFQQLQGQVLNQAELQTYLWHGVKNNHPSIIYNSIKEAFKNNYCNLSCLWGPGIYFASQAIYSKNYAYKLTPQESVDYPNKLIFLLCEVATGKCVNLAPNYSIIEPPNGYDCVISQQLRTDIYVLYGMDVRRAYPSFEIIFE